MTTTEKLQAIRAKCVELLEDAKKYEPHYANAAEAGWKSTIVAVDVFFVLLKTCECYGATDDLLNNKLFNELLSSWPDELLK